MEYVAQTIRVLRNLVPAERSERYSKTEFCAASLIQLNFLA